MNTIDPNNARRIGAVAAAILVAAFAANVMAKDPRRGLEARPEKVRQALDLARALGIQGEVEPASFRLEATFRLKGLPGKAVSGRYSLDWQSSESWIEEISYPGYSRVRQARDGWVEWSSSEPRQPGRVFDLDELLNFVPGPERILPDDDATIGIGLRAGDEPVMGVAEGTEPPWFYPGEPTARRSSVSVRVSPGDHYSLKKSFRYRNRQTFRARSVPRDLEYRQGGHVVVRAKIEALTALDGPITVPTAGSAANTRLPLHCESLTGPEVVRFKHVPVVDSDELFAAKMIVGIDGKVHDLVVLRSAGTDLDRHYKSYLRQQEWRAASCDGVPLDSPVMFTSQESFAIRVGHAP